MIQCKNSKTIYGSAVTVMPYIQMDITDASSVGKKIADMNPDVVVHCGMDGC